jgi:hypothetical protein
VKLADFVILDKNPLKGSAACRPVLLGKLPGSW